MRPVLLELNGFASFREPAAVDFTDADFFALVGPTGSGKSTVIDAMTFALYGSVPRWGRKGMVSLALAPTVSRGTVKLVFTSGGGRYVVARELRRIGTQVSQRAASLERLTSADGLARPGEPTEVLAKDLASVTAEVEKLLGLSFDDFCQCVVLPQGQFANFLHANPRDRQDILLRLLGAEHYRQMMMRANQRAAEAAQRAEILSETLTTYADATQEALDAAVASEAALAALAGRVDVLLPKVHAASTELIAATAELSRLESERSALAAVRVPDETAALDQDLTLARSALDRAADAARAAEESDRAARGALAAGPQRAPLQLASERRAELAERTERTAALNAASTGLKERMVRAQAAETEAAATLTAARAACDRADRAAQEAQRQADELDLKHAALAAVRVPAGIAGLDEEHQAALAGQRSAAASLAEAEQADSDARTAIAAALPPAPLEQALAELAEVERLAAELPVLEARLRQAEADHAAAEAAFKAAAAAQGTRQQELDEARQAHVAAGLRPHLVSGQPCPVCEQPVGTVPPPLRAPALDQAQAKLEEAKQATAKADAAARSAAAGQHAAAAGLATAQDQRTRRLASVRGIVTGLPAEANLPATDALLRQPAGQAGTAAGSDDQAAKLRAAIAELAGCLGDRRALDAAAGQAAASLDSARTVARAAQHRLDQLGADLTAARSALNAARDPLVALGAPAVDADSLAASWRQLVTWAKEQAAARLGDLTAAADAAKTAAATLTSAQADLAAADSELARAQAQARDAAMSEQEARTLLAEQAAQIARLTELLSDAPDEDQVRAQLALLTNLEAAARNAEAAVVRTRADRAAAERALAALEQAAATAISQLSATRDEVVSYGAPALDLAGHGLLAAWTTLAQWAAGQAASRAEATDAAAGQVTACQSSLARLSGQLGTGLAEHGIDVPADLLAARAQTEVATARERAGGVTKRITERRAEAADLTARRAAELEEQQVAKMLGDMLRSDRFPRWLVTAAVDVLVADASANLAALSDGQFDLTHEDGEFYVIDHADADARRSVRTLSGGETFQASLALALALSAQLSALAAAGPARLDSIFLDEGFGTLDAETLEVVATTLETLAQDQRMVGIITHVQALAERVPVRFAVSRDARTSTVVREGLTAADAA